MTETAPAEGPGAVAMDAGDPSDCVPLNVLVVYEEAAGARRALNVLSRLAAQSDGEIDFKRTFWRFDLLEDPAWRDVAAPDVLKADLIILTTRDAAPPPPAIGEWLEECLALRDESKSALLALFGSVADWSLSVRDESSFRTARQMSRPPMEVAAEMERESQFAACV